MNDTVAEEVKAKVERTSSGFIRLSAAVPRCRVADPSANAAAALELWQRAHAEGSAIVVFPELCLCGYTARDLLTDGELLGACDRALGWLAQAGRALETAAVVGLPLRVGSRLFNVAAVLQGGRVLGCVPKSYLPNQREFEETRWFRPGREVAPGSVARVAGHEVPLGTDLLFVGDGERSPVIGIELCEDMWVQVPPSAYQVSAGATVVLNLSASNITVGKSELRRMLVRSLSDRGKCAYVYVGAGPNESSTDLAFDGDAFICENGRELVASPRFAREGQLVTADVDLELLQHERLTTTSFGDCSAVHQRAYRQVRLICSTTVAVPLRREVSPHPFLPADPATLAQRCYEIFEIQAGALATRLQGTRAEGLVLGLSGGIDSTHAALVAVAALDRLGWSREVLRCVTMPGLGTSDATRGNAERLARALGATFERIDIVEATASVLASTHHPALDGVSGAEQLIKRLRDDPAHGDVALENAQARLRTLLLMTLANQHRSLVVGTGDLSEKALGWSTYAGDQIAMYDVNAGVPKTLIQLVVRWVAQQRVGGWTAGDPELLRETLFAILDTPISPELLPADAAGKIAQLTEATIGPFELHDFFLYHVVRHGARPERVLDLARQAFDERYELAALKRWLRVFYQRFFDNQFKRSCTADAPKVGMVALSPRGDWRMPSDAAVRAWLEAIDAYPA